MTSKPLGEDLQFFYFDILFKSRKKPCKGLLVTNTLVKNLIGPLGSFNWIPLYFPGPT